MYKSKIQKAKKDFDDYFTQRRYLSYKTSYEQLEQITKNLPVKFTDKLRLLFSLRTFFMYLTLKKSVGDYESIRVNHNANFISDEFNKQSDFFDNVAAFPLDAQQREAVIADEDNSLVIAGAGSGKTMTIVAKVKYLVEKLDVPADSILPISFTKKSAEEMKERVNVRGVSPQTFHKFGLTVLQEVEKRSPKIYDETNNDKLFRKVVEELSKNDDYLSKLNEYILYYAKIPRSQFEFKTHGDYIQYLKDQNFTTYKRVKVPHRGRETYRNETVKSIEECIIANFLIFNRVDYEYEMQYEFPYAQFGRKKSYKPDFTIATQNGPVYLEHLGMDEQGNVPPFFAGINESHFEASRRYQRMLAWKQQVHSQNRTKLIESYSYEFSNGNLIPNLKRHLEEAGVPLNPMSEDEVWKLIQESGKDEVDGLISLMQTFLSLLKSNGHTVEDVTGFINESDDPEFLKQRAFAFVNLFAPIYDEYESNLHKNGEIDFNDMITKATEYIESGDYYCPLRYVIVDEFQDLSFGRYRILQAIRTQNPDVKFYCVGDDWQSIFRFAGSDITLFSDFEEHFGYTYTSKIETTYRFNEPLIGLSSEFVLKNPHQMPKSLKAPEGKPDTNMTIIESESFDGDDTDYVVEAIGKFVEAGLTPESKVYIIGRYNFDIKRIKNFSKKFTVNFTSGLVKYTFSEGRFKGKTLNMQFVTAHRSKGLEADFTILLNLNTGKYGFPSGKADDPLLNLLLSSSDQFENGEERRLFYVAITRTKKHVAIITEKYRKSKFIKEIQDEHSDERNKCPKCQNGELVLRSGYAGGRGFKFFGCSNFAYGCDYSKAYKPEDAISKPIGQNQQTISDSEATGYSSTKSTNKSTPYKKPTYTKTRSGLADRPRISSNGSAISKLNSSQRNRLEYFVKNPGLYAKSEKGRVKVRDLAKVSNKMNAEELSSFNQAFVMWENASLLKDKSIF
jgi:DNA helicase IV